MVLQGIIIQFLELMIKDVIPLFIFSFGVILVIFLIKFFLYPLKNKRRTRNKITREYIAQKFDDLMGLRAILIMDRDSGILLYSYIMETDDNFKINNPEFISGVLHAMQSLGKEMGFRDQEFYRLQYGDYFITSKLGHHCQAVIVSRNEPSSIIEDNILILIRAFEKKFFNKFYEKKNYFEMSEFKGAREIIREIFDLFFIEGLNLIYDENYSEDLSDLEKIILNQAKKLFDDDKSIVLKKLFINMYGNNVSRIIDRYCREEIIYTMYTLFKSNYFAYFNE
ncbi:MAG: hypothetical protein ACTSVI_17200 [Promethearchaeota archaeon]